MELEIAKIQRYCLTVNTGKFESAISRMLIIFHAFLIIVFPVIAPAEDLPVDSDSNQIPAHHPQNQNLVSVGNDGKLIYQPDERGNRIPDFSRAGYMGGGVSLPTVPVKKVLEPKSDEADDTLRIQTAIDELSGLQPDQCGIRGALLLKRGVYPIAGHIKIKESGVVLRGEGQTSDGTVLLAKGKEQRTLITVSGKLKDSEFESLRRKIIDSYVPWGGNSISLDSTNGLKEGDVVVIRRPGTEKWIHEIGMDRIIQRDGTKQWEAGDYGLNFERVIASIRGERIYLDAPLVNSLDEKYGGGIVCRFRPSGRVEQSGVEAIRLVSAYEKGQDNSDEFHAWSGILLGDVANCWIRNVTVVHFSNGIATGGNAIFTTVQDCAYLHPVSLITGGRRYPFSQHGQYGLVQRCYSEEARHSESTGARVPGPNVFLDCLAERTHADTGPHQRWGMGTLWDNLKGGLFAVQDRQYLGTGQGWTGAQQVFWNCETSTIVCQQPPTGQNYAVGCTGKKVKGLFQRPDGLFVSFGRHVTPRSLYLKQLEDRLGSEAVSNVTSEAQRKGAVYDILKRELSK